MQLSFAEYRQKVLGCWLGKNIGGTLGEPFEGKRQLNELKFYVQDLKGNPPPNDDLDLQLVWLCAAEKYGRRLDAKILAEYWLSYIVPHWSEYGTGKANLRQGIVPPLSGHLHNPYKDSCGCFIRSELWACLAPGHPEIAVRYAYQDAIVDHAHEGLYGEIFCAAMQSAAFVESDPDRLIEIGLSYLPADCGVARGVNAARGAYRKGLSWQEARRAVLTEVPGTFGVQGTSPDKLPKDIPVGKRGYDAPSNIGIVIIGWLYGGGDFGGSLCTAVNCGEDTDCTAATLGALLGIIAGADNIPQDWKEPIGERINTWCIDRTCNWKLPIPQTASQLTERILRLAPQFLDTYCDLLSPQPGYVIETVEREELANRQRTLNYWTTSDFRSELGQSPFAVSYDFVLYSALLDYGQDPLVEEGAPRTFRLTFNNQVGQQQWLRIKWHLPAGWHLDPGPVRSVFLDHTNMGPTTVDFTLTPELLEQDRYDLFIELTSQGRPTKGLIPIVLLHG
jgi:ADP-ribosylglycohydrolase